MRLVHVIVIAAAVVGDVVAWQPRAVARPRLPHLAITSVETPLGLQGLQSAGPNVVIPFRLYDWRGRPREVEAQFGVDWNGDGAITDDEYRPLTEDRNDPRNTRRNAYPQLFASGHEASGAANAFVWRSTADLGTNPIVTVGYALTPQGRTIDDPDNPGTPLVWYTLVDPARPDIPSNRRYGLPGVKVRLRVVLRHRRRGPWAYTDDFPLNNNALPSMTIDGAASAEPGSSTIRVSWTAFDADSEDFNGNEVLDVDRGEDMNLNGVLDPEFVGVAFDWHRLAAGEDPATLTPEQLAALTWLPCTRDATDPEGDTDSMLTRPGQYISGGVPSAPPPVGRQWVFSWDTAADVGPTTDAFLLRATPFDQKRDHGETVYATFVVRPGQ